MKFEEALAALASGFQAGKRAQCCRSIFSLLFQEAWEVRKRCLGPMISPEKKVVRVGWSSVKPKNCQWPDVKAVLWDCLTLYP